MCKASLRRTLILMVSKNFSQSWKSPPVFSPSKCASSACMPLPNAARNAELPGLQVSNSSILFISQSRTCSWERFHTLYKREVKVMVLMPSFLPKQAFKDNCSCKGMASLRILSCMALANPVTKISGNHLRSFATKQSDPLLDLLYPLSPLRKSERVKV